MARLSLSAGRDRHAVEGRDVGVADMDVKANDIIAIRIIVFFISNYYFIMTMQK
jgi:ppGpp synthetase/RelA/SpoT-type nucleotidyltranferase